MENEYKNIAGKSAGEVARDISDFLARTCVVQGRQEMDLANLLPGMTMKEQFSFALLMEARTQGWEPSAAESFYLRTCAPIMGDELSAAMLSAFRDPESPEFLIYREKFGCNFNISSHAYWTACLAVAIDAKEISKLMDYLRGFTFCLMEFAYMGDRNPSTTYAWSYYESFQRILTELMTPPETPVQPKVIAVGGSAGRRDNDGYYLSLGADIQNPNAEHMAWNLQVDITLKDREGNVISTIGDRINCLDAGATYHYGITRKIRGAAVAHISATVRAGDFMKLSTPLMKQIRMEKAKLKRPEDGVRRLTGILTNHYECTIHSYALHYQFINEKNKILGGGCEWYFEDLAPGEQKEFSTACPVPVPGACRVLYSVDFNAQDLT